MKITIKIEKKHLLFLLTLSLISAAGIAIGYGTFDPEYFGHTYGELNLFNSVLSSDIKDHALTGQDMAVTPEGYVQLNVLHTKDADTVRGLSPGQIVDCEFIILRCNGIPANQENPCRSGYKRIPGAFSIEGSAIDNTNVGSCTNTQGNSWLGLCCIDV